MPEQSKLILSSVTRRFLGLGLAAVAVAIGCASFGVEGAVLGRFATPRSPVPRVAHAALLRVPGAQATTSSSQVASGPCSAPVWRDEVTQCLQSELEKAERLLTRVMDSIETRHSELMRLYPPEDDESSTARARPFQRDSAYVEWKALRALDCDLFALHAQRGADFDMHYLRCAISYTAERTRWLRLRNG